MKPSLEAVQVSGVQLRSLAGRQQELGTYSRLPSDHEKDLGNGDHNGCDNSGSEEDLSIRSFELKDDHAKVWFASPQHQCGWCQNRWGSQLQHPPPHNDIDIIAEKYDGHLLLVNIVDGDHLLGAF